MLHLILANKAYSSWSMRPWLVLRAAGIDFEETVIALGEPDTAARIGAWSPSGLVPALRDGDLTVWDSLAITEYLAERFPDRGIWPSAPSARARARSIAAEMHGGFMPLRQALPMNLRVKGTVPLTDPAVLKAVQRVIDIWTTCLEAGPQGGDFLFGPFCAADAFYAPVVTRFETYGIEVPPQARRYMDTVLSFPPMQDWWAAAQAEPWVIAKYEGILKE
ncbi:MAG: glutathione S-transferase family protein [Pseudomonadota bacterium]